jgi:hypothetical protein
VDARGELRLGRAIESDHARHRPEPRARAGHHDAGALAIPEHRPHGPGGHDLSRERQADRRARARRPRGARLHEPHEGSRRSRGARAQRRAGADRAGYLRLRAGRVLAPRPAAGDHRALGPEGWQSRPRW